MADVEPGKYRPRRAFVEPEVPPEPTPKPATKPVTTVPPADLTDEDAPKPLYRDEVAGNPVRTPGPETAGAGVPGPANRPITFTPRRPRPVEEDATTILPRTGSGRRGATAVDTLDDLDDDEHRPLGQRTKLALVIGAVAAVVVVGLAIGYAVLGVGKTPTAQTSPGPSASSTTGSPVSAAPSVALLGDDTLLGVADAGLVADKTWKVASTERGAATAGSASPACFGTDPVEGQPTPQQQVLRLLTSTGKNAPGLLQQATAYASPEDAAQAYAVAAKTLGGCAVTGSYLVSGASVTGIGDQATGAVVASVSGGAASQHTVVLSRTGRVLNIVDATRPDSALPTDDVAKAVAAVTSRECSGAGGSCTASAAVQDGPPPVGGDEPGFLATGDLPPAGKTPMAWSATPPELPTAAFDGSGCESIDWSTLSTVATTSRVYLLQDSGSFFGLNDIVVTMKDKDTATKLVDRIRSNLDSCTKRTLTAQVSDPKKVVGVGAQKTAITGYTAEVTQKSVDGTKHYRVGVVAAGTKVAYTFLNPQDDLDFTADQWDTVAVRAGQRTTQVN